MKAKELKKKYFEFFKEKQHKLISSASLIPEHDPTVLFTTAGMHPLVPYFMGEPHPAGKRLVNVQKCIRTVDIEVVGDPSHLTFFEMLGNWSLGDYWKKEAIEWSFEFLIGGGRLGLDKNKLYITVFKGDKDAPKDLESSKIWESLGIPKKRIYFLPKEDNWWGPAGSTGPCGPCTEMFYDTGKEKCSKDCKPGCSCGKYFEIWNDVFLEYNKKSDGSFEPLKQKTVDTGMGVERTAAMLQGKKNVFEVEMFTPIIDRINENSKKPNTKSIRVVADHLKAAVFMLSENIAPSNLDQGYILRRLIRKSIRHFRILDIEKENFTTEIAKIVIDMYKEDYKELNQNENFILEELEKEEKKFKRTLEKGLREFEKLIKKGTKITGKEAFLLFSSYGFPLEMTEELAQEKGLTLNKKEFEKEFEKHQELSRAGAEKRFKGGLADSSEETKKLHTATHLLNEVIRKVLKDDKIVQKGSNITKERLRFDFNFDRKLTPEEIKKVEDLVNKKIGEALEVKKEEMTLEEAKRKNMQGVFEHKYGDKVSVYSIGKFSMEICGGPHVKNTKELGKFKIIKEESSAAGIRRIKAVLE
ncbi:alanine--tRNA ligase [Candidatus Woesearchaeota archaeon]|nr:alanine--tRNA ligase [Candidatus Woesearchaeota archaeon]|tara:strand:- start:4773 stop:6527 length:1755 start_codon:yes stop_codon:yes gene_type:complete